ncbi:energy-coupling factor ABC transporter ATP-binding protein [Eubacterium oxidoreducens]|uniref:Cobalt/nickel transport system ATP-binding protein n=1 Tax=Eubacterium oxidoreducens TaxID=1732 RepID=A0A1G6AEL5_EUBOX|nr:ABC transporter ATP-binding protein [Eubacterium oxidoreducens]SDB06543.1 cobalt/nickel transport system ATP-binding protein [Eubacterium oxidoreducens]
MKKNEAVEFPIMELKNVCFAYGRQVALRNVSFSVNQKETVVITGPNGCGKSTLLKLMNGLIFAQEGNYSFANDEITEKKMQNQLYAKAFHQKIGYVFQNSDVQLFCGSVKEEIEFGPLQMGLDYKEVAKRRDDVAKLFRIEHLLERAPYHLSGGEKRKVALACVLSMNPEVLVMDEPLAGLDKKSQMWLMEFLQYMKKSKKTMIISTHNEELTDLLKDRVVEMNEAYTIQRIL